MDILREFIDTREHVVSGLGKLKIYIIEWHRREEESLKIRERKYNGSLSLDERVVSSVRFVNNKKMNVPAIKK